MHPWLGPSPLPSSMPAPCLSIGHLVSRWTSVHGHVALPFTFNFMFIYCRYFTSLCFTRRYIGSVCLFLVRCGLICSYTYERGCSRRCCVGGGGGGVLCDQSIVVGVGGWSKAGSVVRLDSVFRQRRPLSRAWAFFRPLAPTSVSALFDSMQSSVPRRCVAPVDHSERPNATGAIERNSYPTLFSKTSHMSRRTKSLTGRSERSGHLERRMDVAQAMYQRQQLQKQAAVLSRTQSDASS